ncbi:ECF transporter S component [Erysipelothrix urinaevulpis]|uniref:ECF transporter S component n=1 Tax=Erysipelothrix urinaevulpis TaxID=2683717 RepID=UPI001356B72D|nr:ECF transporter S component [Erysipelothrix urinaevulpis]
MKNNTRQMVQIALLSAISIIFFAFAFRVLPGIPLKVDLSDYPVLIAAYTMGPIPGLMVALIKNIMHVLFLSSDGTFVGEMVNFVFAVLLMYPVSKIKTHDSKKNFIILFTGLLIALIGIHLFNYYVSFPMYGMANEESLKMLLTVFLPFNIVKGSILYLVFILSRPYLDRIHQ